MKTNRNPLTETKNESVIATCITIYIYFWTKNIYIVIHVANIFLDQEYILIATKLLN